MEIIRGKICNDMPNDLYEQLKKIDFTKLTENDYNEIIKIVNDFKMLIPFKKAIVLSERELTADKEIIKLLNVIDYRKSNKNILNIAINYLKNNIRIWLGIHQL